MKELKYYGGIGYDNSELFGLFEVRSNEIKRFTNLTEAIKHYNSLNEEKALWDMSPGSAELLECHMFENSKLDNNLHKIDSSISGAIKYKLNEDSQELYTLRDTASAYDYNKPFYYKFAKNHKKKR